MLRRTFFRIGSIALMAAVTAACAATGGSAGAGKQVVLVAGATGGTGQGAVNAALAAGYEVRVLVRDEARARQVFGDRVSYVVGNVREPATLPAAVKGATYVISALGSNVRNDPENRPELVDYGGVKALVDASKAAKVKHFVLVSSMGVTQPDHYLNKMFDNILQWKLRGENHLRESGVPYTVVRPGGLRDSPAGQTGLVALQGDPKDRQGQISRADVGAICVAALGRGEAQGKTFEVIGDPKGTPPADWKPFFAALAPDRK